MLSRKIAIVTALSLATFAVANASAQLQVTEAMSLSGTGGTPDWFEVTNFGPSAVNITGSRVDDNSNSFTSSLPLNNVTSIAAGESIVFVESAAALTEIPAFRSQWNIPLSVQIGDYAGSGVGLSGAGDAVNLYDSAGNLLNNVTFAAATTGSSFGYNPVTNTFGAVSVLGVFGAYTANVGTGLIANTASPGLIPEPATLGLVAAGAIVALRRRRA